MSPESNARMNHQINQTVTGTRTTSTLLLFCIIISTLLSTTRAQTFLPSYPDGHAFCSHKNFKRVDVSNAYKANSVVPKAICVLQYYNVCATVTGAESCNDAVGVCRTVKYAWDQPAINPISASVMTRAPEVCASSGGYYHPEFAVYAIAQPVIAFVVFVVSIVLVVLSVRHAGMLPGLWTLLGFMFVSCVFLLFGVWYLNAYLAMLVTIVGVGMFASRHKSAILIGLLTIFVGLLWFTYGPGLGQVQHHLRLTNSSVERYESACDSFYKGYFADPVVFKSSYVSPLIPTRHYCLREYIAVEFFFLFFIELLFLILFAYGGYKMTRPDDDVVGKAEYSQ